MNKLESIQDLFSRTMTDVTNGTWPEFLKTSAWTFKYSFPDQLLIYAQRPDATACASIELWNKRLGRTVREDAAHIALIDDRGDEIKLHYVVDVSDTEGPRDIPLWRLTAQNREYVYTALAAAFNVPAPRAEQSSTDFFEALARRVVENQMSQASFSLQRIQSSCEGLKDLTPSAAEAMFREFLVPSVTAVMMHRCNLVPEFREPDSSLYGNIGLFKDPRAFSILGQTLQSVSRDALLVAAKAAMDYDRTHKEEISNERNVSESRGVQDPGIGNSREQTPESVRQTSQDISAGESSQRVHGDDDHGSADSPSERPGAAGTADVRESAEGSGGEKPSPEQSSERGSLDSTYDEAADRSGGRGSDGAGVRSADVNLPDAGEYGINVSFPTQEEQAAQIASGQPLSQLPQNEIDLVLLSDFTNKVDLGKVRSFYLENPNSEEAIDFLKETYKGLEDSVMMPDGNYISVEALKSGLFLVSDDTRGMIPWDNLSSRIRSLLEDGRYPEPVQTDEARLPESSAQLSVGQKFSIAGVNYLVTGITDGFVSLQDADYPIFTNTMPRATLDLLFRNNARSVPLPVEEKNESFVTEQSENLAETIASVGPFYEAYLEVKKEYPDYHVFVKLNDGYFAFEKDAEEASRLLNLPVVNRSVLHRKKPVMVCFLENESFSDQSHVLAQSGVGLVLADRVPGEGITSFVILSSADALKAKETTVSQEPEPIPEAVSEEPAPVSSVEGPLKEDQPSEPAPELSSEAPTTKAFKEGNDPLSKRNYRFLEHYAPEVMNGNLDYIRLESETFEPLYIERIGHNRIAIAHTFEQGGDLFYDPEMVFAVQEDSKELLPLSFEQSAIAVYQQVYEDDVNLSGKNKALEKDLNSFFKTWSQNLLWQEHKRVLGIKHRTSGDLEYTFDESGKMVLKEEPEKELPKAPEVPSESSGKTGLYVGDIVSFDNDDFQITSIDDGWAYSVSEKDGSAGVPMQVSQILNQIQGGGTTRLTHFWERQDYQPERDDQRVLSLLLNHFETWHTSRGVYVPGELYGSAIKRMAEFYVSDNEDHNKRFILEAATEIRRWFPENDDTFSRRLNTASYLSEADFFADFDPSFPHMGNVLRLPQWKDGDEQLLLHDLQELLQGKNHVYENKVEHLPKGVYDQTSEHAAEIAAMAGFLSMHKPDREGLTWQQQALYDSTVRNAEVYLQDIPALYPVPGGRLGPQSLYVGDLYNNDGTKWQVSDISEGIVEMHSLETGELSEPVSVSDVLRSVRNDPDVDLTHFWERDNSSELVEEYARNQRKETEKPVPEAPFEEPAPHDIELYPFQVGDYYEDENGKGVITQVFPEEYEGRHRPMFSYRDPEAPEGSRAAKGYVISSEAASERIHSGRATLIPASERASEPAPEKEVSLFDFDFDPQPSEASSPVPVNAVPEAEGRINYQIPKEAENYGGPKARFRNNIEAIRLLKDLEAKNELATPEQQQILARYVGWGGLQQAFDPKESGWKNEYEELREVLTEAEYESARESTLTAFYTPPAVTEAIYTALSNFGFRRGNILDPCCGTGNFFGMLPDHMAKSKLYGVELDSISGRISRQLYQQANILIEGFEKTKLPDSFYDAAVGNVPFGSYKLADRRYDKENFLIHDYFFAKTLDKVRPGGIVAFVTSKGTMDKANDSVRRYIAQRADLLGAIRLPNNTFKENAGTEAVADILFLQKRSRPMVQEPDWVGLGRHYDWENSTWGPEINQYFIDNPEMVLGELKEVSGPYGPELTCVAREGEDLREALQRAVANISGEIDLSLDLPEEEAERSAIPADPNVRNFSFTLVDGDIYFREDSQMFQPKLNKKAEQRVKGMIELRDLTRELIDAQLRDEPDSVIFDLQRQLNVAYDTFSEKFGLINSRANSLAFSDDSSYFLLCSLENVDDQGNFLGKADMFYKRTIGRHVPVSHTDTAREALAVCMGERGRVDLDFISRLCGLTEEEVLLDLKGLVFPVPGREGEYEISSTYLSGNVRKKLAEAQEAAEEDPRFAVNAEYLENAIPEPLEPEDISVRLGATWVPQEDVTDFIHELLNFDEYWYLQNYKERIKAVYEPLIDSWQITNKNWDTNRPIVNSTYGTARVPAYRLIEDALNQKNTQVFDVVEGPDGKERRVLNADETIAARDKQEQIKEKFKEWLWKEPDRSERLAKLYNEKFNSVVPPEYDANMVLFHGINPLIQLEDHQKEAIARVLFGGNTQLAHVVGAGKTWTMVAAAMEGKNLGLCNKSLMVVPNHLVGQWASAIYELYPAANVLASTKKDFETKNRKKFCSRIATGDYDIVVIGHSQFERIPLSAERQEATLKDQIADITASIASMDSYEKSFTIKQMERTKKSLQAKLEKLQNSKQRDDVVTFEELGVDRLFVDESHEFKNLFLYTKMHNVAGISQTDSQKASDLFMKCRYIDEITDNMGNIHATGTPLSNTMAELYTTQRYLQYDLLQEMGLGSFDAWASTFGETVQSIELAPEGTGYRERTRFANFFNIPELVAIYKQVADVRTADMLNLPVPEVEYHTNVVPASEEQKEEVEKLAERADNIRQRKVTSKDDNMLCVTNDGRKLALDQRLVNPELPDNPNSKANACVDEIMKYYREGEEEKLTQLVFCDLSTPTGNDFNVYQDLKDKLVAQGIPADEIRFIHEANTDEQKEALFAKVRSGAVRVLMGSTGKMGTGTNVQDRLIAGHDLDCPWRPSDLEQRAGRVIRRGNGNSKVHIHRYVTENTFDAYLYQLIEAKQRFASQIFTSKSPVRVAADVDESVLNYSQIKALASGNPKIREKIELEIDLARLKTVENNYKRDQRHLEFKIQNIPKDIDELEQRLAGLQADLDFINEGPSRTEKGELLPCEVQGVVYEKQKEAGEALFKAMKHLPKQGEWFTIGHLRDLRIIARQPHYKDYVELCIAGPYRRYGVQYGSDPGGLMVRLNNVLDSGIPMSIEHCKYDIEKKERELQSAKEAFGKPFSSAEILRQKRERLQVLEKELSLDNQEQVQGDSAMDAPAPEVTTSRSLADKIADAERRSSMQKTESPGRTASEWSHS